MIRIGRLEVGPLGLLLETDHAGVADAVQQRYGGFLHARGPAEATVRLLANPTGAAEPDEIPVSIGEHGPRRHLVPTQLGLAPHEKGELVPFHFDLVQRRFLALQRPPRQTPPDAIPKQALSTVFNDLIGRPCRAARHILTSCLRSPRPLPTRTGMSASASCRGPCSHSCRIAGPF